MSKVTLNTVSSFQNDSSAVATVNADLATITTAFDNTLSRDGTSPNTMSAALDMNGNKILNVPTPTLSTDLVRLGDLGSVSGSASSITFVPTGGVTSTNVQNAIVELDTKKAAIANLANVAFSGSVADLSGQATQINTANVTGGSAAGSSLTLQSTSNVAASGDAIKFEVGNNGALEQSRIISDTGPVSRRIINGTTSFNNFFSGVGALEQYNITAATSAIILPVSYARWDNTNGSLRHVYGRSRGGGVVGVQGALLDGDGAMSVESHGSDGTNMGLMCRIQGFCDGGNSAGSTPGKLIFATTPSGTNVSSTRMTIWRDGGISMNSDTTSPGAGVLKVSSLVAPPFITLTVTGMNFNSVADTAVTIPTLPTGWTRVRVLDLTVSHASAAIAAAAVGLFTTTGGGGVAVVPATTLTSIVTTSENTSGNCQRIAGSTVAEVQPSSLGTVNTLQLRNTTAQGTAVTADVTMVLALLP